jgi:hypothetical protein
MRIPTNVLAFSAKNGLKGLLEAFIDLWNHKRDNDGVAGHKGYSAVDQAGNQITFSQKEESLNRLFTKEVCRLANVSFSDEIDMAHWSTNPSIVWSAFSVVDMMIEAVIPDVMNETVGAYTEVRSAGFGDNFKFTIKPRDLFYITKAGRGRRQGELQRQYKNTVTLTPENHLVSVYASLFRILAGRESLSEFVFKAVMSMEAEMSYDVFAAFNTAMGNLPTTPADGELKFVGYSQQNLTELIQRVSAFNKSPAVVLGTQIALQSIMPADANYIYTLDSEFVRLGYVTNVFGANVIMLPQISDWKNPYKLLLDDTRIYVVSPGADKIVKLCLEGSPITYQSGQFDAADLTQSFTTQKSWIAGVVTNAIAGIITAS